MPGSTKSRDIRISEHEDKSHSQISLPDAGTSSLDLEGGCEDGEEPLYDNDGDDCESHLLRSSSFVPNHQSRFPHGSSLRPSSSSRSRWTRRRRIAFLPRWIVCGTRSSAHDERDECSTCKKRRRPLKLILKSLAVALMILGLIEFVILVGGLVTSFFPSELDDTYSNWRSRRPSDPSMHWPTDYTADIQPIQCHSHNDYWRPIPLKSALKAGCTGVEADVWLFPEQNSEELFVGHSRASLTPQRTFKSLYIDPLVEILERQNPNTTFHRTLDNPLNGVFDTTPTQTLVLLVDFKTDGQKLWPAVSQQLEPLRQGKYLSHFNGTAVIEGPITVVVTGNAPFNKVVENPHYRDMFFDAPLELLGNLAPADDFPHTSETSTDPPPWTTFDDFEERIYLASYAAELASSISGSTNDLASNQGQGHSGAAPKNPAIYTPANSFYASVAFTTTIGYPFPFLTGRQKTKVHQQIAGAHTQGLKVRYWSTPAWPIGSRNYIWRFLVLAGVDYLNVDDLWSASRGHWGGPKRRRVAWDLGDWNVWGRRRQPSVGRK